MSGLPFFAYLTLVYQYESILVGCLVGAFRSLVQDFWELPQEDKSSGCCR